MVSRLSPAIAAQGFQGYVARNAARPQNPTMRIAIFGGCAQDFIYPEQLKAAVKVMGSQKYCHIDYPMEQTCCGLPVVEMMGQRKTSVDIAKQNLAAFDPSFKSMTI